MSAPLVVGEALGNSEHVCIYTSRWSQEEREENGAEEEWLPLVV